MSKLAKALSGAAGNAAGGPPYVEDVFSTYLYTGTGNSSYNSGDGSNQNIVSGIDLSGEGGMVWTKSRNNAVRHSVVDTERGATKMLNTDETGAEATTTDSTISFNSNGHTLGVDNGFQRVNFKGTVPYNFAAWTFRKAEKFFDVVTYTGNSTAGRTIAHNLGSVPGMMIVKGTSNATAWWIFHTSTGATKFLEFSSQPPTTDNASWNNTAPTDSVFTLGSDNSVNGSGRTYVAYLFASDAGGFGDDEDENIIKCGSYVGNGGSALNSINLGFEPQWVMVKNASATGNWHMLDVMRGFSVAASSSGPFGGNPLYANLSNAEGSGTRTLNPTATGFEFSSGTAAFNNNGNTFIYMAIRRGPMKTPEAGTEVFASQNPGNPLNSAGEAFTSGFPVDWALSKEVSATDDWLAMSRLQGEGNFLETNTTAAEASGITYGTFDHMTGWFSTASANMSWMFRRAPGFFDVVCYTGTGVAGQTQAHNLGVVPELMIVKWRNNGNDPWVAYSATLGATKFLEVNTDAGENAILGMWNNTAPTASVFTLGNRSETNNSNPYDKYIAYLFATVAGVSKVGSYTGTGSSLNVPCGFTAGARFILIKRTDTGGGWYIYDSTRGISASGTNDPYLFINTAAAQVTNTDYIGILNAGFTVTSSAPAGLNSNGGTYIFLAIA